MTVTAEPDRLEDAHAPNSWKTPAPDGRAPSLTCSARVPAWRLTTVHMGVQHRHAGPCSGGTLACRHRTPRGGLHTSKSAQGCQPPRNVPEAAHARIVARSPTHVARPHAPEARMDTTSAQRSLRFIWRRQRRRSRAEDHRWSRLGTRHATRRHPALGTPHLNTLNASSSQPHQRPACSTERGVH